MIYVRREGRKGKRKREGKRGGRGGHSPSRALLEFRWKEKETERNLWRKEKKEGKRERSYTTFGPRTSLLRQEEKEERDRGGGEGEERGF